MLILALAFIAFFGLVTAAVLQFADAVELQQSHEQSATNEHADTEGAVLFAAAADLQLKDCPNPGVSTTVDGYYVQSALYPVSYTHLDVYKRQGLGYCPCDDSNCSAGQYSLNGLTLGNGVVASPIRQRDVQESTTGNPGYVVASCSNGQFDYGVQEITITVSKGPASVSRVVWKGDLP